MIDIGDMKVPEDFPNTVVQRVRIAWPEDCHFIPIYLSEDEPLIVESKDAD